MNAVNALYGGADDPRFGSLTGQVVTGTSTAVFGAHADRAEAMAANLW